MTQSDAIFNVDFSAPRGLTGSANRALSSWQTTACSILKEIWQGLLGSEFDLNLGQLDSSVAQKAIRSLPDPGYAARLAIGEERFPAFVVFSAQTIQALVSDMLGTLGEEWPEVKPLTPAEASMVELLMGEVARSFSVAWPDVDPLQCFLQSVVSRPLRSRVFPPDEILARTRITLTLPLGTDEITLLFPRAGLASIGIVETDPQESAAQPATPQLRALAEKLPVTLIVELGRASLTLKQMNNLAVGDVLMLDQPVTAPLEASIGGKLQWLGHPCRMGPRQGFRVIATASQKRQPTKHQ
ncbi:MAG: FliM/FliN family flagellar motor switch protein [Planctomycetaceae bacterium]|nr:FliM/FliN family flagellar motor switch protein [Planctomycetaceae bacterium]